MMFRLGRKRDEFNAVNGHERDGVKKSGEE